MVPGGSFDLDQYIDPYEVNFVAEVIDEDLAERVDGIAVKIITEEIAKIPQMDIGDLAEHLKLRANKAVKIDDASLKDVALKTFEEQEAQKELNVAQHEIEEMKKAASLGLITKDQVVQFMSGEISFDELMGG